jgi:uncharacterized protein YjbI with pentapeptide repeats
VNCTAKRIPQIRILEATMANNIVHVKLLRQGTPVWNDWRKNNPALVADLRRADLRGLDLRGANLSRVNLRGADLRRADFNGADLRGADLRRADFNGADFNGADFNGADLRGADLSQASLYKANFYDANLSGAKLIRTQLIRTDFCHAELTGSSIYGISAWDVKLDANTKQGDLIITRPDEPAITVDNIKVAQFIYLLLDNREIRDVINTITSKAVLILGLLFQRAEAHPRRHPG